MCFAVCFTTNLFVHCVTWWTRSLTGFLHVWTWLLPHQFGLWLFKPRVTSDSWRRAQKFLFTGFIFTPIYRPDCSSDLRGWRSLTVVLGNILHFTYLTLKRGCHRPSTSNLRPLIPATSHNNNNNNNGGLHARVRAAEDIEPIRVTRAKFSAPLPLRWAKKDCYVRFLLLLSVCKPYTSFLYMLRLFFSVFWWAPPIGLEYELQRVELFIMDPFGHKYSWKIILVRVDMALVKQSVCLGWIHSPTNNRINPHDHVVQLVSHSNTEQPLQITICLTWQTFTDEVILSFYSRYVESRLPSSLSDSLLEVIATVDQTKRLKV